MNKKIQLRRIKTLLYTIGFSSFTESIKDEINKRYDWYVSSYDSLHMKYARKKAEDIIELKHLINQTNISDKELMSMYLIQKMYKNESQKLLKHITPVVRRDNKGVYIGGGGSNVNKVRYPSKKRSLRVWKKFYEMFPRYAERDNWNGKTSDRMK